MEWNGGVLEVVTILLVFGLGENGDWKFIMEGPALGMRLASVLAKTSEGFNFINTNLKTRLDY